MDFELTSEQKAAHQEFRMFVDQEIMPYSDQFDEAQAMPAEVVEKMAKAGYLAAVVPKAHGGLEMDATTFGLLCHEIGRGSASLLSLLTVHGMVCQAILKWGSAEHKTHWLPKLATGEAIGAFGLTEPNIGSDARNIETRVAPTEDGNYRLTGHKQWISFAQVANLFLIIAQCEDKPTAFLVERKTEGFSTEPMSGLLGFRSAMLAKIHMDECLIPASNMIGRIGFGFTHVAGTALDHGRYCIAWGCVGMGQGCLDSSLHYSGTREQFGKFLKDHQLIQQMTADMLTQIKAARLLCLHAGTLKDKGDPSLIMETSIAKYFASNMVQKVAEQAVQIHGANGCSTAYPVQRYYRDAKIMEIIEGSNQMQQMIIAKYGYQNFMTASRQTAN